MAERKKPRTKRLDAAQGSSEARNEAYLGVRRVSTGAADEVMRQKRRRVSALGGKQAGAAPSSWKSQFALLEEELIKTWEKAGVFQKSLDQRQNAPIFSFYDGPPFASGEPHYGHLEQTAVKDAINRYKTMRGYYVPRRTGYDTHGLPIEFLVEKELGLKTKQDIVKYGIDKFNAACRAIVFRHRHDFEAMYRRMGRWGDQNEAYATLDLTYMESVWWVFSQLYEKGLVYRGYKSIAYCPRCATPLSNFEVNDGYRDNVPDPSLYVKFKLADENAYLVGWTTTPWSLPGNATLALKPSETYVYIESSDDNGGKEVLILAKKRLEVISGDYAVIKEVSADELVGRQYEPLFKLPSDRIKGYPNLYRVITDEAVSVQDGTGVLHIAPAFGEDDLEIGKKHYLPVLYSVDDNGKMRGDIGLKTVDGLFFKTADEPIIENLAKKGLVYAVDSSFTHTYPFCWRCETPLLYYAINTWFIAVTKLQKDLLKAAQSTSWVPGHVKKGRFVSWLAGARDWAISRNRFWGTPLPIWVNEQDETDIIVVKSVDELRQLTDNKHQITDLHRPLIDQFKIERNGKVYRRVEEVFDCWFESGSMPFAQDHYPFENKGKFKSTFPADFIVEAIEQVHLWFYTLHVLATALEKQPAYKNIIADGLILAADGKKLSKRLKNYPPISQLLDKYGADTTRFFILSSPLMDGEDTRLNEDVLRDIYRNVFMTLNNSFSFFKTYTEIDNWQPPSKLAEPKVKHLLDKWLLSRLNESVTEVTFQSDKYQIARATRPLIGLIDDLSNWYIRRSRRRFWKTEDDQDKEQAYETLHYTLARVCQLLAPWSPFLSDKIFQHLMPKTNNLNSVHLSDWPKSGKVNNKIVKNMALARDFINQGLAQRAAAGIKVRQPLSSVVVPKLPSEFGPIIADELNVKNLEWGKGNRVELNTELTEELKQEGLARDLIRLIQSARKQAGLDIADRITLGLKTENNDLRAAISAFADQIAAETLSVEIKLDAPAGGHHSTVSLNGQNVIISLAKSTQSVKIKS